MQWLKQSTAATELIGPVLDANGAAYTGLAIGDLNLTANGTTAAMASAAAVTYSHEGHYLLLFTAANCGALGRLTVTCNKATYAMPPARFEVLHANVYDVLVGSVAPSTHTAAQVATLVGDLLPDGFADFEPVTPAELPANFDALALDTSGRVILQPTGLDAITVTAPTGVATTFPSMVVQVWRRFFKKTVKTSTQIKTYADNNATVLTTQTISDDTATQTQGAAS